jgi:anti-sigma B factor antagonist/stage II sporulation protein AA (anti-sigma F factor antagonist)
VNDPLARLTFEESGEVVVAHVDGEVESSNAPELRSAIGNRLRHDSAGLVLDLSGTSYLDSAGVELVFELARQMRTHRQSLRLVVPVGAPMRRVLDLCDVDQVAPLDPTVDAALAAIETAR